MVISVAHRDAASQLKFGKSTARHPYHGITRRRLAAENAPYDHDATMSHRSREARRRTSPVKNDSAVHDSVKNSSTSALTKPPCSTYLLYMRTITSRDLVHRSKEIRKRLSAGQTLRWTSHGLPVALIQPASAQVPLAKPDWMSRARAAGAVHSSHPSVADTVYQDRG